MLGLCGPKVLVLARVAAAKESRKMKRSKNTSQLTSSNVWSVLLAVRSTPINKKRALSLTHLQRYLEAWAVAGPWCLKAWKALGSCEALCSKGWEGLGSKQTLLLLACSSQRK